LLVEGSAKFREAAGLADDQAPQLQDPWLHEPTEQPSCQAAKIGLEVTAVLELEHLVVDRLGDRLDRAEHDL